MMAELVSVIVPTYREQDNIEPLLMRLAAVVPQVGGRLEILVVDNDSEDGTVERARAVFSRIPVGRVIESGRQGGLAEAVFVGIQQARGEIVAVMDADLSHPPELLPALVEQVRAGAEIAVASRYVRAGGIRDWPWSRRMLSRVGTSLVRPLVPVSDATSGYFAARADVLRRLTHPPQGFKILLEILVQLRLRRVREVPYLFTDRRAGVSKLGAKIVWLYGCQVIRLYGTRVIRRARALVRGAGEC